MSSVDTGVLVWNLQEINVVTQGPDKEQDASSVAACAKK
jgi:hypothetical protein